MEKYRTTLLTPWIRNGVLLAKGTIVEDVTESEKTALVDVLGRKESFEIVAATTTDTPKKAKA